MSEPWSPQDSRTEKPNDATYRVVNQAEIDDVQTSSNPEVPTPDSRKDVPVDSDVAPPQNSRNNPNPNA